MKQTPNPASRRALSVLEHVASWIAASGIGIWNADNHRVNAAIWRLQLAWRLAHRADDAVQLAIMYDRVNRNRDGFDLLREAFIRDRDDPYLHYMLASTALRHGSREEVQDVFEAMREADPGGPFAAFVLRFLADFEANSERILECVGEPADGRRCFLLVNVVWGEEFVSEFMDRCVATLLAPRNLPVLTSRYDAHFIIFTTERDEASLRRHPLFSLLERTIKVHIVRYDDELFAFRRALTDRYGDVTRYGERLSDYFERLWRFCLMSGAHYATIEAGRRLDAFVTPLCADNMIGDGGIERLVELMEAGGDVVNVTVVRLARSEVAGHLTADVRRADGTLVLSNQRLSEAIANHMPREYFVDHNNFARFPLMLCWRVDNEGILVHSTHFHPLCIRAAVLRHRLGLTVDPVDGRFLARQFPHNTRMLTVNDASVICVDLSAAPLFEQATGKVKGFSIRDAGLWLSGYWDDVREQLFRTTIRYGRNGDDPAWNAAASDAERIVSQVISVAKQFQPPRPEQSIIRRPADDGWGH